MTRFIGKAALFLVPVCWLGGCVTQARHEALLDEAVQAERQRAQQFEELAEEREQARQEASEELEAVRDRSSELELELAQSQQALQASEELVEQLRNELGRVGGHLVHFGDRAKQAEKFESRVQFLEKRLAAVLEIANLLIDPEDRDAKSARVHVAKGGDVVIEVLSRALFYGKGSTLSRQGRTLVRQLAPLGSDELGFSLTLSHSSNDEALGNERVEKVKELLLASGAAEASVSLARPTPVAKDETVRLRLGFSNPRRAPQEPERQHEAGDTSVDPNAPPNDA